MTMRMRTIYLNASSLHAGAEADFAHAHYTVKACIQDGRDYAHAHCTVKRVECRHAGTLELLDTIPIRQIYVGRSISKVS